MDKPKATNPHWVDGKPAWDVVLSNGELHKGVTERDIGKACRELVNSGVMSHYTDYIDVVRQNHIEGYSLYHTQKSTTRSAG